MSSSPDEPAPVRASTAGSDIDLPHGDHLLGVPPRSFLRLHAVRGLALVVVALVILLWPDRTDRTLGWLVGLGLAIYAVAAAWQLVRSPASRDFRSLLTVSAAGGSAAALLVRPEDSIISVAQIAGIGMLVIAGADMLRMVVSRSSSAWGVTRSAALVLAGVLLILFPGTLLVATTSIVAGLLAAAGLIHVFAPTDGEAATSESGFAPMMTGWLRRRPDEAEGRDELQSKLFFEGGDSAVRFARFATLMLFASIIASVGVIIESVAVVIGAMLVAPLMTPLMGTAFAATMGWPRRMRRSAGVASAGVAIAIATGAIVGAIVPRAVDVSGNVEILARISPTMVDLAIAVAAGAAGAYALARRDVSDALPGVAVAIALVPPLAVVGLSWGQGAWAEGNGALLLFMTNAAAILVAGGGTFLLVGAVPLARVSETQERLSTLIVGLLAFAAVVVLLLLLNGSRLASTEFALSGVEDTVAEWTAEHEAHQVVDIRALSDGAIVIELTGPGRPPGLEALLDDLAEEAGDDVEVRVAWTEQEQVTVGGP